jgi:hypothetical protein
LQLNTAEGLLARLLRFNFAWVYNSRTALKFPFFTFPRAARARGATLHSPSDDSQPHRELARRGAHTRAARGTGRRRRAAAGWGGVYLTLSECLSPPPPLESSQTLLSRRARSLKTRLQRTIYVVKRTIYIYKRTVAFASHGADQTVYHTVDRLWRTGGLPVGAPMARPRRGRRMQRERTPTETEAQGPFKSRCQRVG